MTLLQYTLNSLDEHQEELTGIQNDSLFDTANPPPIQKQPAVVKNDIMADDAFGEIQTNSMRNVEEVELNLNVRVFEYDGETVISGDIPNNVLVKVTNGGITIN